MRSQDNRYEEYIAEHIRKGTTTCALTCKEGVVLAADTRASAGFFIADRHVMKIQRVDSHLGMTIAGGVADAQNLVDIVRISNKGPSVSSLPLGSVLTYYSICDTSLTTCY